MVVDIKDQRELCFIISERTTYSLNWFELNNIFRNNLQVIKNKENRIREVINIWFKSEIPKVEIETEISSKYKDLWLNYCNWWNNLNFNKGEKDD